MLNGVINVYKEKGYTSHDVVAKMRGIFRQKKIGHTGTLDPDAEGVLPVCLGNATRLSDYLTDKTKCYRAVLLLGVTTDTQDSSGQVLSERPVDCTEEALRETAAAFLGPQLQVPPMYSALKVNGKKLVDLARRGIEVERKPRPVEILELTVEEVTLPRAVLTVRCSKGTYIRTLCHDIGERLGTGGCMESLLRLSTGGFSLENAHRLKELEEAVQAGEPERYLLPTDACLKEYPALSGTAEADRFLLNGNPVSAELLEELDSAAAPNLQSEEPRPEERSAAEPQTEERQTAEPRPEACRVYDSRGRFIGLYRFEEGNENRPDRYRPVKLFLPES